ncbi:hypothetical protein A1Q2_01493 [Trichosporon asahii var. asahii CBS 8904]|uniref:Uncharacterized protein n=1 Tax=Trichosporon asahii var. asahii (strain CBS 8904) TaxID=1220162 RepID=K1VUM8_TRIAC|nr:hypothetical protein A1Q2_01493 [Trichosporon asahii var. asahii CBS 8904]
MTLTSPDDLPYRRSPRPLSPPPKSSSPPMLISLDLDSPNVPLYHATTQASVLFLLALLELAPPHLHRYIDPPQPLPPMFETDGTQMDLESLLFLCKDVLSTLCPALLDTDGWDQLVEKVLLLREDDDSDYDSDIPIYQSDWEKQWEYSDEEEDEPLQELNHFTSQGRGRQGFSSNRSWEVYGLQDGDVIRDEFDDVEKDGEGDPDADKEWHDALDSIGCMELVSRACEMLAEWVEENGEPVSLIHSRELTAVHTHSGLRRRGAPPLGTNATLSGLTLERSAQAEAAARREQGDRLCLCVVGGAVCRA